MSYPTLTILNNACGRRNLNVVVAKQLKEVQGDAIIFSESFNVIIWDQRNVEVVYAEFDFDSAKDAMYAASEWLTDRSYIP